MALVAPEVGWIFGGVSLAIWDYTVLPATQHKLTHPALTPAQQGSTRFTYEWKAELT